MTTEINVQDTAAVSVVSDSSGPRNHRCSSRTVRKWQINAEIFNRINPSKVLKYVIVLVLFAGWLAITWSRVSLFLSEPTATKVYWEKGYTPPAFSICPRAKVNMSKFNNSGSFSAFPSGMDSFEIYPLPTPIPFPDEPLYKLLESDGLPLSHMLETLYWKTYSPYPKEGESPWKDGKSIDGIVKAILNYAFGGICGTFMPKPNTKVVFLKLHRHRDFELPVREYIGDRYRNSYELHLHGSHEFWGAPVPGMGTYLITNDTRLTILLVTAEREVRPNLRRAPCESDPSYSIYACYRRCYFDWLHCRLNKSAEDDGRPLCLELDAFPYRVLLGLGVFDKFISDLNLTSGVEPIDRCRCPDPCISHRYRFQIRLKPYSSHDNKLALGMRFEDVQRVMETYVTYTAPELLADMGGYMVLLLGWSLLSFFGAVHRIVARACKRVLCDMRRETSAMET